MLNKWRTKVFEMLVQLKSFEINFKQEKHLEEKNLQEFADRLENETSRARILENMIEDKKAELCVLSNDNTVLNEQLSILKETNGDLEKKRQQDLQSSLELKNFVDLLLKDYQKIEESFKTANKKLTHLDQRVEFAKNRLSVVKALYGRRDVELKRGNVLNMTSNLSSIQGSANLNAAQMSSLESGFSVKNGNENDDEEKFKVIQI